MHETLLIGLRADLPEHTPEAEPVLVCLQGDNVTLTLDDGVQLHLDVAELLGALDRGHVRMLRAA